MSDILLCYLKCPCIQSVPRSSLISNSCWRKHELNKFLFCSSSKWSLTRSTFFFFFFLQLKVSVWKSRKHQQPPRLWNTRGAGKHERDPSDQYTNTHEGLLLYRLLRCACVWKRICNLLGRGHTFEVKKTTNRGMFKDVQRKCVVSAALSSSECFWNWGTVWIYKQYPTEWDKFILAVIEYSKDN